MSLCSGCGSNFRYPCLTIFQLMIGPFTCQRVLTEPLSIISITLICCTLTRPVFKANGPLTSVPVFRGLIYPLDNTAQGFQRPRLSTGLSAVIRTGAFSSVRGIYSNLYLFSPDSIVQIRNHRDEKKPQACEQACGFLSHQDVLRHPEKCKWRNGRDSNPRPPA